MTKSFTPNVLLTRSAEAIDELFFASNNFNTSYTDRIQKLDKKYRDSFIISPQRSNSFISMEYDFPTSTGEPAPTLTVVFLESSEILEYFALNQGPISEVVKARVSGTQLEKRIAEQGFNLTLDKVNRTFNEYFISFGVGDNLSEWAGPFRLTLKDANITLNSDGVRQIELFFVPEVKAFTQAHSRTASFRDYNLIQNKLKAAEDKGTRFENSSNPIFIKKSDLNKGPNGYIRNVIHSYIQNLLTDNAESPNVITLIPQDLGKAGYKQESVVQKARTVSTGGGGRLGSVQTRTIPEKSIDQYYTFDKIGVPDDVSDDIELYSGRTVTHGQLLNLFNKFQIDIDMLYKDKPLNGMIQAKNDDASSLILAASASQDLTAKIGKGEDTEIITLAKQEFERGITALAVSNGKNPTQVINGLTYPLQIGPFTNTPGVSLAKLGANPGATAQYLANAIFGTSNPQILAQLEATVFPAWNSITKAKETISREAAKRKEEYERTAAGREVRASSKDASLKFDRLYQAPITIQGAEDRLKLAQAEQQKVNAQANKELAYNNRISRGTLSSQRLLGDAISKEITTILDVKRDLQKDYSRQFQKVPVAVSIRMHASINHTDDDTTSLLDPIFNFYDALKTCYSGDQALRDFRFFYENDRRILKIMKKYGIVDTVDKPLVLYGDEQEILNFIYGFGDKDTPSKFMFSYLDPDGAIDWKAYREEIKALHLLKGRTSSFKEAIDFSLIKKVNSSDLTATTTSDKDTDKSLMFLYNVANGNVIDANYSFKGYIADMYSLPMENEKRMKSLQTEVNQILQDDDLEINKLARVVADYGAPNESFDSIRTRIVDAVLNQSDENDEIVRAIGQVPGFDGSSNVNFITFLDTVTYIAFIRSGGKPSYAKIPQDSNISAKYAAVLKRLYQRVVVLDLKTLPFFNQVLFVDRPCEFFGIQNSIKGGVLDSMLVPSFLNGKYKIVGVKHVINNNADAFSEFTIVKDGFEGGKTSVALGDVLKGRLKEIGA